jgi:trimethylamine--corrinoid protein Co-methyltransferase
VHERTNPPIINKPALTRALPELNIVGQDVIEQIHEAALRILETTGIDFNDEAALRSWTQAGAQVEEQRVRIPRKLLMDLISSVPSSYEFHARNPANSVTVGGKKTIFANSYGAPFVYDLDGNRRVSQLSDAENFLKLAQMSSAMHVAGIIPVEPQDIAVEKRHLHLVYAALRYTDKPIMGIVTAPERARDTIDMLRIVFGNEFVENNTVVTGLLNCNSPLVWDETMLGALRVYASANQAALLTPFVLAGASTPSSIIGGVAQLIAEALPGLAYSQLVRRGCPMVMGVAIMGVSMKTGAPMMGTAEPGLMNLIVGQMARYYGVPWRSCAMWTGSKATDLQAGYDSANATWPVLLAGCNYVVHAAGMCEGALAVSYSKFVHDAYQIEGYYRFFEGVGSDDLDNVLKDIDQVGPGGHFLGTDHTRENPFLINPLQNNDSYEQWVEEGSRNADIVGREEARRQLDRFVAPDIDADIDQALRAFIARREAEIDTSLL